MNQAYNGLGRAEYARLRAPYAPKHPRIVFVLESPPVSGKYFYNSDGRTTEPLFTAMMKDVLDASPRTKHEGLTEFAVRGYLLDATYVPVNVPGPVSARNKAATQIQKDFPRLVHDLHQHVHADTQLLLIKANVCRLLNKLLTQDGFKVINGDLVIPFPSNGQPPKFRKLVRQVLGLS